MLSSTPSLTICNVDVHMGGQEFAVSRTEHRDCPAPRSLRCGPHQGAAHQPPCAICRRDVSLLQAGAARCFPEASPSRLRPRARRATHVSRCRGGALRGVVGPSSPARGPPRHGPPRVAPAGCRLPAAPSCPRALSLLRATDPAPAPHAVGGGFVGVWGDNCIFDTKIAV